MKRYLLILLLSLPAATLFSDTIAVVNFQTVFQEYHELQRLDQEFRGEVESFQKKQQEAVAALQAKQQEFNQLRQQAAQPEVTDEQREEFATQATALLEELNAEEQKLRQERQTFQQELEAKGVRLRRRIVDSVRKQIEGFAGTQGWDLVLDSSANGQNGLPVIQYFNPEMDKTRWVITELNLAAARKAEEE
jgi:outer membrane protein